MLIGIVEKQLIQKEVGIKNLLKDKQRKSEVLILIIYAFCQKIIDLLTKLLSKQTT